MLVGATVIAGCGGDAVEGEPAQQTSKMAAEPAPPRVVRGSIPLAQAPRVVLSFCVEERKPVPVLCPSVFPRGVGPEPRRDPRDFSGRDFTPAGYPGYLVNFNDSSARTADLGHVILGAQPRPFSLAGRPGVGWPRPSKRPDSEMRIGAAGTLIHQTTVHGLAAIVVRSKPYPDGGIHGGHVVVLWNENAHGYLVSVHYAGGREKYSERERIIAAQTVAASSSSRISR